MRTQGYTLLEMIIVTAIVASLVALTIPAMNSSLGSGELGDAAKRVRDALAKARLAAIESGRPYRFRFQGDGRRFEIGPKPSVSVGTGLPFTSDRAMVTAAPAGEGQRARREDEPVQYELPEGIRFRAPPDDPTTNDDVEPELPSFDSGTTVRLGTERWSAPIVFYPNGRTSNARIRLLGVREMQVDVSLRGVTGTATIGPAVHVKVNELVEPQAD